MSNGECPTASLGTLGLIEPQRRIPDPLLLPGETAIPWLVEDLKIDGVGALFLEAYSSTLQFQLFREVPVQAGAFTNLGIDHLDVHGTVEYYYQAKKKLFQEVIDPGGVAIINIDAPQYEELSSLCRLRKIEVISYGCKDGADLRLISIEQRKRNFAPTEAEITAFGQRLHVELPFTVEFMALNALCASGLAIAAGLEEKTVVDSLSRLEAPVGRMEWIAGYAGGNVFVDYAHTPDSLGAALSALRSTTLGRIILVFGCGGERDNSKRSLMGAVASELADIVIITDDNPRNEEANSIRSTIVAACPGAQDFASRREAIRYALHQLEAGDTLLVAGKGHEVYQEIGGKKLPFSDRDVILEEVLE